MEDHFRMLAATLDEDGIAQSFLGAEAAGYVDEGRQFFAAVQLQVHLFVNALVSSRLATLHSKVSQGKRPVIISGARSRFGNKLNGVYIMTSDRRNGKPLYIKEGCPFRRLFLNSEDRWVVSDSLDGKLDDAFAYSETEMVLPHMAENWHSGDNDASKNFNVTIMVRFV